MFNGQIRIVLDTNVVFEGLTKKNGACGKIIDAWLNGEFVVFVSNALAYEYVAVLSRKLAPERWKQAKVALRTLLDLAQFTIIHYSWRPASPDPGDDFVIDCAMNANALLVTANVRDFRRAQNQLGLLVTTPEQFVKYLGR